MSTGKVGRLREFEVVAGRAFLAGNLRESGWNSTRMSEGSGTLRSNVYKKLELCRKAFDE